MRFPSLQTISAHTYPCQGPLPDETTILNFRHILEKHKLGLGLLDEINAHLESQGLKLREGTIGEATIIEAPSSTKNWAGEWDPEMDQTKKGNQWRFGMKAHIGVDSDTGIVHSMSATAANAHAVPPASSLQRPPLLPRPRLLLRATLATSRPSRSSPVPICPVSSPEPC